jgi:hypothetical protein
VLFQMQYKMICFQLLSHRKHQLTKLAFGLFGNLFEFILFRDFFSDETYTENILEKQADLLRYLHERNDHLSRLVHQLKHQLNSQPTSTNTV